MRATLSVCLCLLCMMLYANAAPSPGVGVVMWLTGKGFEKATNDVMACKEIDISKWEEFEGCVGKVRDDICSGQYSGDPDTDCGIFYESVKWVGIVEVLNAKYCSDFGCRKEIAEHICQYYSGDFDECVNFYVEPEEEKKTTLPKLPPIKSKLTGSKRALSLKNILSEYHK